MHRFLDHFLISLFISYKGLFSPDLLVRSGLDFSCTDLTLWKIQVFFYRSHLRYPAFKLWGFFTSFKLDLYLFNVLFKVFRIFLSNFCCLSFFWWFWLKDLLGFISISHFYICQQSRYLFELVKYVDFY